MKILVITANEKVKSQLKQHLLQLNYEVLSESFANKAFLKFKAEKPDLVILDLILNDYDELELCRKIRAETAIPIIILSAFGTIQDRLTGFTAGATDYIIKPFSIKELAARINALLHSVGAPNPNSQKNQTNFSIANISFDRIKQQVYRGKRTIKLTKIESKLLELLILNAGQHLSRPTILDKIWGYTPERPMDLRAVDVYIARLRAKIEEIPSKPELILTVRGLGYKLPKH